MIRRIALALLILSMAGPAHAQPDRLAGTWSFDSRLGPDGDCRISGRATIAPAGARGIYSVHTVGNEVCSHARWESEQDCTARRTGAQVQIECQLVRADPTNYAPDNFALTIVSNDLMRGELLSTRRGQAVWRRREALVS